MNTSHVYTFFSHLGIKILMAYCCSFVGVPRKTEDSSLDFYPGFQKDRQDRKDGACF